MMAAGADMGEAAKSIITVVVVLVALLSLAGGMIFVERRLLAFWQERWGPNRLGPAGLLQSVADIVKIFTKEDWIPPFADRPVFVLAPAIIVATTLTSFGVVMFAPGIGIADMNIGVLFFLAMSALGVYSVALGGWSSNSKYALLGGMRAAAQMLSYEIFMGLSLMGVVMMAGSFRLTAIVEAQRSMWFCIPQFFGFVIFFIAGIAETHRLPFDLPEAENELVQGYQTEYSGMKFAMFLLGEYFAITMIAALTATLFFGGWQGPSITVVGVPVLPPLAWFIVKTLFFISIFFLLRAALPRPRYDQLMSFGWKVMFPLALLNLLVTAAIILSAR
jgi:NADH-quinone oxidoreductase subunit H